MEITLGAEILGPTPLVVSVSEKFEFVDGKRGNRSGTAYEVVLPHARFDKIRVTVPDLSPTITQDELNARNIRMEPVKASFDGFVAKPYVDKSGKISYSAKADKITFLGFKKEGM